MLLSSLLYVCHLHIITIEVSEYYANITEHENKCFKNDDVDDDDDTRQENFTCTCKNRKPKQLYQIRYTTNSQTY